MKKTLVREYIIQVFEYEQPEKRELTPDEKLKIAIQKREQEIRNYIKKAGEKK